MSRLFYDGIIGLVFLFVIVVFGLGLHRFNNCSLKDGQAFVQSKKHLAAMQARQHFFFRSSSSSSQICMCVCACVHAARHLVAPAGFANATVWVTLQQFAPHHLIFFLIFFFFFGGLDVLSLQWRRLLHMGSFHPAVVFITTAAFFFFL